LRDAGHRVRALVRPETDISALSWSVDINRELRSTLDEADYIESTDLLQRDSYAITKADQERIVRRFAQQNTWELIVLHPGAIWGSGHLDLPNLGQRLGPLYLIIAPSATLPLSYVENCAEIFTRTATANASQTLNVVDDELVTAWYFAGEYLRRTRQAAIRVPVPYHFGLLAGHLTSAVQRTILFGSFSLPNILRPRCVEACFKPLRYSNAALRRALKWQPRFNFYQAWDHALRPSSTRPAEASHG
jgi:nucleoside-diphosphate-sugar epimerase